MEVQRAGVAFNPGLAPHPQALPPEPACVNRDSGLSMFTVTPEAALSALRGFPRDCHSRRLPLKTSRIPASARPWPAGLARFRRPEMPAGSSMAEAEGPEWRARTRPFLKAPASQASSAVLPTIQGCRRAPGVGGSRMVTERKRAWAEWKACRLGECGPESVPRVASTLIPGRPPPLQPRQETRAPLRRSPLLQGAHYVRPTVGPGP